MQSLLHHPKLHCPLALSRLSPTYSSTRCISKCIQQRSPQTRIQHIQHITARTLSSSRPLRRDAPLPPGTRNPLDEIHLHRQHMVAQAQSNRRLWLYGSGMVATIIATYIWTLMYPVPETAENQNQNQHKNKNNSPNNSGKLLTEAPPNKDPEAAGFSTAAGSGAIAIHDRVATGADAVPYFPKSITLPSHDSAQNRTVSAALPAGLGDLVSSSEEYHLMGLGVRTVSFLRIKVYVVGLYVAASDLAALQAAFVKAGADVEAASTLVPAEQAKLRGMLLDAQGSETLWNDFLTQHRDVRCVLRIVPTRDTDFAHLRDGWVRAVEARAGASGNPYVEPLDERFGDSVAAFRGLFSGAGKPKVRRGRAILLERDVGGVLRAWVQSESGGDNGGSGAGDDGDGFEKLGEIQDERIGRLIWLGYFGGKNVASQAARESVVEGIIEAVGRPVGTFEAQVV